MLNNSKAIIGTPLPIPEEGWIRYNEKHKEVMFVGHWLTTDNDGENYGGTLTYTNKKDSYVMFKFYGDSLRLLSTTAPQDNKEVSVIIDGIEEKYSAYSGTMIRQVFVYEKTGLEMKQHTVRIFKNEPSDSVFFGIDAIDIPRQGHLCDYDTCDTHEYVSHTNAFHAQTLPMNTTERILAKTNDSREGLLGMANDQENYGDLYVVGKDGKSHLTKSGIKSEVIFEGKASTLGNYILNNNVKNFKQLIVVGDATSANGVDYYEVTTTIDTKAISNTSGVAKYTLLYSTNTSTGTITSSRIGLCFPTDTTLEIAFTSLGASNYKSIQITKVIGIY